MLCKSSFLIMRAKSNFTLYISAYLPYTCTLLVNYIILLLHFSSLLIRFSWKICLCLSPRVLRKYPKTTFPGKTNYEKLWDLYRNNNWTGLKKWCCFILLYHVSVTRESKCSSDVVNKQPYRLFVSYEFFCHV